MQEEIMEREDHHSGLEHEPRFALAPAATPLCGHVRRRKQRGQGHQTIAVPQAC